jgi:AraC-like DNA-binding protein
MTRLIADAGDTATLYSTLTSGSLALLLLFGVVLILQNANRPERKVPQQALGVSLLLRAMELGWVLYAYFAVETYWPPYTSILPVRVLSLALVVFGCHMVYPIYALRPQKENWPLAACVIAVPPLVVIGFHDTDLRVPAVIYIHLAHLWMVVRALRFKGEDAGTLRFFTWMSLLVLATFDLAFFHPILGGALHRILIIVGYAVVTYSLCLGKGAQEDEEEKEKSPEPPPATEPQLEERIEKFMDDVHPERDPGCTLGWMAQRFGVASSAFSAAIRQMGYANFLDFVNQRRVAGFKDGVAQGRYNSHSVLEKIAAELGFGSARSFFRAVQRYENMGPAEYIRENE